MLQLVPRFSQQQLLYRSALTMMDNDDARAVVNHADIVLVRLPVDHPADHLVGHPVGHLVDLPDAHLDGRVRRRGVTVRAPDAIIVTSAVTNAVHERFPRVPNVIKRYVVEL